MDPADSPRKRSSRFDGTRLVLGGPPCCRSSLAAYPSAHSSASSPRTPRSRRERPSRSREDYYEPDSNQLTPAQAFYKMLGIILVPPDTPSAPTSLQEQPHQNPPSSHSASFMNTTARVSPVWENRSFRFKSDYSPIGSEDCAPDVLSNPGIKTVSSRTLYSGAMFVQSADQQPPSVQLADQQPSSVRLADQRPPSAQFTAPRMDPAVSEERLRGEVMDKVYRMCELWWEKPTEGLRRAVERRLQGMLFEFPWLVDSLNSVVLDFLLSTLHLHSPPQAAHRPGQLVDSQPETPAPTSTWKRRSRRRRSSPQPPSRTSQEPAVVSNKDTFSFLTPSAFLFSVDGDTADAAASRPTVRLASPHSAVSAPLAASPSVDVAPSSSHLHVVTPRPSSSPALPSPSPPAYTASPSSPPDHPSVGPSEREPQPTHDGSIWEVYSTLRESSSILTSLLALQVINNPRHERGINLHRCQLITQEGQPDGTE
ncbi:uncharacterized protein LOC121815566 [Haplochromis burtoni]|uniref:uncharacterized protein LOC121815566 n=1 Tax=Haplochromis burtoni TaxID=8153 RepID=UPI001C2DEA46|nr:uncharacterized protein LOC121815566 [Haplochromis burtoni]